MSHLDSPLSWEFPSPIACCGGYSCLCKVPFLQSCPSSFWKVCALLLHHGPVSSLIRPPNLVLTTPALKTGACLKCLSCPFTCQHGTPGGSGCGQAWRTWASLRWFAGSWTPNWSYLGLISWSVSPREILPSPSWGAQAWLPALWMPQEERTWPSKVGGVRTSGSSADGPRAHTPQAAN